MRLTDDIPGLFDAPAVEDISVKVDGTDLVGDQFKQGFRRNLNRKGNEES